jgi:excisionase family DNA binding protein
MDTAGRAPMHVVLPAAGAEVVLVLLKRAGIERYAGQMTPPARAAVEEFLRQLGMAARWQQEWDAELTCDVSVDGNAEGPVAEGAGVSPQEIEPEEAAVLLKVTPSRVRQLCRARELVARQVGRSWRIDRASVELRVMGRAA